MEDKSIADFRFPIANLGSTRFNRQSEMGNWQLIIKEDVIEQP
jgi:hypothetical protein